MATYYVDFDNGDDSNAGSYAAPWKLAPYMPGFDGSYSASNDDRILLARGATWRLDGTINADGWEITSKRPTTKLLIGAYDRAGRTSDAAPIVQAITELSSGWTEHTGGIWKLESTPNLRRLWLDREGFGRAPDINSFTSGLRWYWDGVDGSPGTLYVYSAADPSELYLVEVASRQCLYAVRLAQCANIFIEEVELQGGFSSCLGVFDGLTNPSTNIRIERVRVRYAGTGGVKLEASANASRSTGGYVGNCDFDKVWFAGENEQVDIEDDDAAGDGVFVSEGWDGVLVDRNALKNFTHNGVNVNAVEADDQPVANVRVSFNDISAPDSNYGRGLGCNARAGNFTNIVFEGNLVHDTSVRNQFNGENVTVVGNLFTNFFSQTAYEGLPRSQGIGLSASATGTIASGLVIRHNTFVDCEDECIRIAVFGSATVGSNTIDSNLFVSTGGQYVTASGIGTISDQTVTNNVFWGRDGVAAVTWNGTSYETIEDANAALTGWSSNVDQDPGLSDTITARVSPSGPCAYRGVWTPYRTIDQLPFPLNPDIGAVQDRTAPGRRFGVAGGTL